MYLPLPVRWWCLQKNWSHLRSTHSFWPSVCLRANQPVSRVHVWKRREFDSCAAVCSVPNEVPGLTWCACLLERHQASSSCVAMAARWCAARVRAFRRRRSRSSVAPRRRAADAVVATIVAARRHARARRPGIPLLGAARSVDVL